MGIKMDEDYCVDCGNEYKNMTKNADWINA